MKVGDNVRFLGWTKEQVAWGNNDTPYMLILDRVYEVINVVRHSQHTKVQIKGVLGSFNSVHFQVID